MFDLDFKKTFTLGGEEKLNGRWYGGEPVSRFGWHRNRDFSL